MPKNMTLNLTADQLANIRLLANAPHFPGIAIDCYAIPAATMAVLRQVLETNGIDTGWALKHARHQERRRSI